MQIKDIFGFLFVLAVLYICYRLIWLAICVSYLDRYWERFVKIADENGLQVFCTNHQDGAPIERVYHFINSDIRIKISSIKARRLFKRLERKTITKEKLVRMSRWESCRIPR